MRELMLVLAVAASFAGTSALYFAPWLPVVRAGAALTGVGFVLGVPAGVVYHVLLYRALSRRDVLARGWIWRPIEQHPLLLPDERGPVLGFCYAGGLGFGVLCLGLLLFVVGGISGMLHGLSSG